MSSRTFLLAAILSLANTFASAHSPYFTQIEPIDLPNGSKGELRLLHGDGILFADPVRVIAIDNQQRLIARSEHGRTARILCASPSKCAAYLDGRMFELSPEIRPGPVIEGLSEHGSPGRDDLEYSDRHWGFVTRPASLAENLAASIGIARTTWLALLIHTTIGAIAGAAILGCIVRPYRTRGRKTLIAGIIVVVLVVPTLAVMSAYLMLLVSLTHVLWLGALVTGAVLVFSGSAILRLRPARAAP